ncbi:MAG: hypothetical protein WC899_12135 [bacterium]|jgi:hypothetical protein
MRKKELNIPSTDALTGAQLALANARRHLASADAIAAINEHGMACGHLVLAIEESAKACFLAYHSLGLSLSNILMKDILSRHDFRHGMTNINLVFMEINGIILKHVLLGSQEMKKLRTIKSKKEVRDRHVQFMIEEMRLLAEGDPNTSVINSLLEWIKTANEKKNTAFYVDYSGGTWKSPSDIHDAIFMKGREAAVNSIELHAKMVGLALEMTLKEREELIRDIKEDISKYPFMDKFMKDA